MNGDNYKALLEKNIADVVEAFGLKAKPSADAVFTKVGYGTFAEAACNGVRLLSWPRPDWAERSGTASRRGPVDSHARTWRWRRVRVVGRGSW